MIDHDLQSMPNKIQFCWRRYVKPFTYFCFRPDRDKHIKILFENVMPEKFENFDKKSNFEIDSLGQPYDYYSIMHYRKVCLTTHTL